MKTRQRPPGSHHPSFEAFPEGPRGPSASPQAFLRVPPCSAIPEDTGHQGCVPAVIGDDNFVGTVEIKRI